MPANGHHPGVQRTRLAWLLAISLMPLGSLVAHALAYRIVEPDAHDRTATLAATGHGYLAYAPLVLGASLAIAAGALLALVRRSARGCDGAPVCDWTLALLPPAGFAVQEHLERLLATGDAPALVAEPVFLVGLLLQLPFALAVLAGARVLTRAAVALGRALGAPPRARPRRSDSPPGPATFDLVRPLRVATGGAGVRAPPLARP